MSKLKILCFVFGSLYLFQGISNEVKADEGGGFTDILGKVGAAVDAAKSHKSDKSQPPAGDVPVE